MQEIWVKKNSKYVQSSRNLVQIIFLDQELNRINFVDFGLDLDKGAI